MATSTWVKGWPTNPTMLDWNQRHLPTDGQNDRVGQEDYFLIFSPKSKPKLNHEEA